jgi:two-component system, sensor histidine kinase PdtaS
MRKSFFLTLVCCLLITTGGSSQSSKQQTSLTPVYRPASQDKPNWQRLNLWLSSYHLKLTSWALGIDSSLIFVSRSLGLSRLAVAAEGIDNAELIAQSQWFDQRDPRKAVRLLSEATGKKRLELMILLGAYYAFENNSFKLHKDSVEHFLKMAVDESKKAKENGLRRVALCLLVKFYGLGNDLENCTAIFNQLIDECRAAGDQKNEARAYAYWGLFSPYNVPTEKRTALERIQDKIHKLDTAAKKYSALKDVEGQVFVQTMMGNYLLATSRIAEAEAAYTKALELERSIGYPYVHYTTNILATLGTVQQKFGEPLKYALETARVAEAVRDSIGWGSFYDRLGVLYYIEGEREEESLKWMLKALDRHVLAKAATGYQTLYNAAAVLIDLHRGTEALELALDVSKKLPPADPSDHIYKNLALANAYMGVENFKVAEQYVKTADSVQKKFNPTALSNAYERTMVNTTFASLYYNAGQFAKAKKYLDIYLADSTRVNALANDIAVYKKYLAIDSVFKDHASAVKHYKMYMQLVDSSFRIAKVRQAEELSVMYETEEKNNEIALLNAQAKAEQANLKQATTMRNVTIGGIVVALVIAGLLYRQGRLRKKSNKVITQKNEQLQHLLTEKEWLLKEIHHRVKNNLQIVMSLLNSQSAYIDNEPALTAIHDSQHRVHAMSLIHQKLYNTENVSTIDMSNYIRELISYLADSYDTGQRIRFNLNIEPLEMDVSQAIPLGLILNEAITNSIKYAFPDNRNGLISVSLEKNTDNRYLLTIADNGIGMPPGFDNKKPGSLGISLMKGLSEDLDGSSSIENDNGTTIKISFLHDVKRPSLLSGSFISNN